MNKKEYKIHTDNFNNIKTEGLYLIRNIDNNLLKIGITNDLQKRFEQIKRSFKFCGNAPNLNIEVFIEYKHNLQLEQYLHKKFAECNHQNEWFDINDVNIVLSKLKYFKYTEEIVVSSPNKRKNKHIQIEKEYRWKYYEYTLGINNHKYLLLIKDYNCDDLSDLKIDDIATKVGYMWHSMAIYGDLATEKFGDMSELEKEFTRLNAEVITFKDGRYINFEEILAKELVEWKTKCLVENKINIIKIIDNLSKYKCDSKNIEELKKQVEQIEEKCVDIQQLINKSISPDRRKNYKYGEHGAI